MDTPQFSDSEFLDQTVLNSAFGLTYSSILSVTDLTNSPGLINPGYLTFVPSGLSLTVAGPYPFAVLFGNGVIAGCYGMTDGSDSTSTTVSLAPLVPVLGTTTVYIVATPAQIQQSPYEVVGPPPGHPDFSSTFNAYTAYAENRDTLNIIATTTVPDNLTTIELARVLLNAGATVVPTIITGFQPLASSLLNPTGVTPGVYAGTTVTVGSDGRITGIVGVPYGPLAGNNNWVGVNTYAQGLVVANNAAVQGKAINGVPQVLIRVDQNNNNQVAVGTGGAFYVSNSSYSATVLTVDNSGDLNISGGLNTVGGATIAGPINCGGTIGSTGAITAAGGQLIATYGAKGTGNGNIATLLSDFTRDIGGFVANTYIFWEDPNGTIIQAYTGNTTTGADFITFPQAFPNTCVQVIASEGNPVGWGTGSQPSIFGTEQLSNTSFAIYCSKWSGSAWALEGGVTFRYIAIGY